MSAPPSLLFASYHAYLDHASGAALATRDLFEALTARGWACRAVCGPALDYRDGRDPAGVLHALGVPHHAERCAPPNGGRYELYHYVLGGVPVTQYRPDPYDPARPPTRDEGVPFLDIAGQACERFRPDVVLTYGGPPVATHLMARARKGGARVLFCLHNLNYRDRTLFDGADAVWVPSEFARRAYRERLGLATETVPLPWDRTRVLADPAGRGHVTFVNPIPAKGAAWFARIALELGRRRPEVPFLVVDGRARVEDLGRLPVDLSGLRNLRGMRSTTRPREFYALSRVVLVPSVCEDAYPRVGCEALANGLPVLASRRGGLPEVLGDAGVLFDVPDRYAANHLAVPSAEEVAPWVAALERLWDDPDVYAGHRARALERARAWDPERVLPAVEAYLRRVAAGGR